MPIADARTTNNAPRRPITTARRLAESDERYPGVVAVLNRQHRVIRCRDGLQWILQYRNSLGTGARRTETVAGSDWRGWSYCRTKKALLRCCGERAGPVDAAASAAMMALPERIEVQQ